MTLSFVIDVPTDSQDLDSGWQNNQPNSTVVAILYLLGLESTYNAEVTSSSKDTPAIPASGLAIKEDIIVPFKGK